MSRPRKRLLLVGGLLAVGFAAVGIAYAAIPNGGVISGCYAKNSGSLRVIDSPTTTCRNGENALAWNQQGPKGDKGDQGLKGDKGDQGLKGDKGDPGQPGSSAAYTNYGSGSLQDIAEGDTQTVASVTLPTGSYTLMATVYVISGGGDTRFGQCFFAPGAPLRQRDGGSRLCRGQRREAPTHGGCDRDLGDAPRVPAVLRARRCDPRNRCTDRNQGRNDHALGIGIRTGRLTGNVRRAGWFSPPASGTMR